MKFPASNGIADKLAGVVGIVRPNSITIESYDLKIATSTYINLKLREFYRRIFREAIMLEFYNKSWFQLGLLGNYLVGNYRTYSVVDVAVMSALGGTVQIGYVPVGTKDDPTKPLPKIIQGEFCGFLQKITLSNNVGERTVVTPSATWEWKPLLRPLFELEANMLETMLLNMNISNTPILSFDTSNVHGSSSEVEIKLRQQLNEIVDNWKKGKRKPIYLQQSSKFEFPDLDATKFEYIQTIVAQEISKITGFTISWLLGRSPQGMNSTGEHEQLQNIRLLKTYGAEFCLPLMTASILSLTDNIKELINLTKLGVSYKRTPQEVREAMEFLSYLGAANTFVKDESKRAQIEAIILDTIGL